MKTQSKKKNKNNLSQVGFLGIDQYGSTYHLSKYPRKELLETLGATKAVKMYRDAKGGQARHTGYVIRGLWIKLFRVYEFEQPATA